LTAARAIDAYTSLNVDSTSVSFPFAARTPSPIWAARANAASRSVV
jgi:hypothetical protein